MLLLLVQPTLYLPCIFYWCNGQLWHMHILIFHEIFPVLYQFMNPEDAEDAQYEMDRTMFNGREITVVFAEENRKRPEDMRARERHGG